MVIAFTLTLRCIGNIPRNIRPITNLGGGRRPDNNSPTNPIQSFTYFPEYYIYHFAITPLYTLMRRGWVMA